MFKPLLRLALAAGTVALFAAGSASAQFAAVPGRDYAPLNPPQPKITDTPIEVLEFFAYGCIHCFHLEPRLEKWKTTLPKDTKLTRVPSPVAIRGLDSVPMYYTLEAMGMLDKLHYKIFEAMHNENVILGNPSVRDQWLAKNAVDPKKYQEVEQSFSVQNKIRAAREYSQKYRIESTPTLVVNGKYSVPNQRDMDTTFRIVESLIATERASAKTVEAAAPATPAAAVKATPATAAPAAKPAPAPSKTSAPAPK
ncbi:MAG: thiol:disulfide interchange protein DsbA/DsbL [Betaproteobacteria bacterium]|nr:thiol:disulfide interchange protein DsbA/DsbL [Betaproteobacteria bacterium]